MAKKFNKTPKKKYPKGLDENYEQEVEALSAEELKKRVVNYREEITQNRAWLKGDELVVPEDKIEGARAARQLKQAYDEVAAPVRETNTILNNKIEFVLKLLREKGAV